MKKNLLILFFALTLTSCANISDKIPKLERKACDGSNETLADMICKKAE